MSFTKIDHYEKEYVDHHHDSALSVTEGVADQPIVNPYFVRKKKHRLSTEEYVKGILEGNITTLSQAITLIESQPHCIVRRRGDHRTLLPASRSVRIGITGVPGAGKSTFIEAIGNMVTSLRHKLAVLAIDPSSERSGGSILGDKTRMESISANPDVFIRPSPSAGSLGGVARKTRETIVLCEAAGFDVIFIETVGVGQSETAVHSMVDLFMLLQISGAGDELQGIKRGIMEMADLMVITKADGENIHKAELAKTQFQSALQLFPLPESEWRPRVYTCSAVSGAGLEEVWKGVEEFLDHTQGNGFFRHNRNRQNKYWMYETIDETLKNSFYRDPRIEAAIGGWTLKFGSSKSWDASIDGLYSPTLFRGKGGMMHGCRSRNDRRRIRLLNGADALFSAVRGAGISGLRRFRPSCVAELRRKPLCGVFCRALPEIADPKRINPFIFRPMLSFWKIITNFAHP